MAENTKKLKEKMFYKAEDGFKKLSDEKIDKAYDFCEGYMKFLGENKTERECVCTAEKMLIDAGFEKYNETRKEPYAPGSKVYKVQRKKAIIAAVIGKNPIENGVRIAAAHIDSPRLDLKPNPMYEDSDIAYFKTHYYGGIKKYQWPTIPLSLHGVICKKNGECISVNIGEKASEPQFVISDILPHLDREQMSRKTADIIKGEELNVIIGSRSFRDDEESELVKLNVLNILFEKYGMCESD